MGKDVMLALHIVVGTISAVNVIYFIKTNGMKVLAASAAVLNYVAAVLYFCNKYNH